MRSRRVRLVAGLMGAAIVAPAALGALYVATELAGDPTVREIWVEGVGVAEIAILAAGGALVAFAVWPRRARRPSSPSAPNPAPTSS